MEPTCPRCGHFNAMLVIAWDERGKGIRKCRDCHHVTHPPVDRVAPAKEERRQADATEEGKSW